MPMPGPESVRRLSFRKGGTLTALDALKRKWFLDFQRDRQAIPPAARHPMSLVQRHTDGNRVTPLVDGKDYMKAWHDQLNAMEGGPGCETYQAAWRIDSVRVLGHTRPESDAIRVLRRAKRRGVKHYILTSLMNYKSTARMIFKGLRSTHADLRAPAGGSNHQKFICFKSPGRERAMVGSLDISYTRWDTPEHRTVDAERDPVHGKPTHDVGVLLEGPAIRDLENVFRLRWNDPSRDGGVFPRPRTRIETPVSSPPAAGTHSVQVLETYGIGRPELGYPWSDAGEFTLWASYLNAIKASREYVYIEDQYFLPFDWPPAFSRGGAARESDIIYQLGEAVKRGVKVIVIVPGIVEDAAHVFFNYQRNVGIRYLEETAQGSPGDFMVCCLHNGTSPIYMHSKLMICDDEFVAVGSANIGRRSMTCDSELQLGIVDEQGRFAREFRKRLWSEHLEEPCPDDFTGAFELFRDKMESDTERLRRYRFRLSGTPPAQHGNFLSELFEVYAGPPREPGR